jgi:uncharacterized protein YgiM (DUF1202 family)
MKSLKLIILSLTLTTQLIAGIPGAVNANKLNVRVSPSTKFSVVKTLSRGDSVDVLSKTDDNKWFEISLPENSEVWVSKPFVKDGVVIKSVNLRCGPSVAYTKYKTIDPGTKLEIIDDSNPDWLKIKPIPGLVAYVAKEYITIMPIKMTDKKQKNKKISKPKVVANTKAPIKEKKLTQKETPKKQATAKVKSKNYVKQTERTVSFQGILLPLARKNPLATHCIVIKIHDEYIKTCYLTATRYNLKLWEKKKINIRGIQHWVKGWVLPVIEVERIQPVWN